MGFRGISEPLPRVRAAVRLTALGLGCLTLANCSANMSSRVDPRYGVLSSARVVEPGRAGAEGRRRLPGRQALHDRRPRICAARGHQLQRRRPCLLVRRRFPRPLHRQRRNLRHEFDLGGASDAAAAVLMCASPICATSKSIIVRVNDRGPYVGNRVIDVSVRTAKLLGFYGNGVAKVKVEYVGRAPLAGSDDRKLAATLREGAPATGVQVASAQAFVAGGVRCASAQTIRLGSPVAARAPIPARRGRARCAQRSARRAPATMALAGRTRPNPSTARAAPRDARRFPPMRPCAMMPALRLMSGRGLY